MTETYRISHITDLMQIQPEHWDECMRDLRGFVISLHLIEAAAGADGRKVDMRKHCPFVNLTPDGKGEITPTVDGRELFTIKVTRDEP